MTGGWREVGDRVFARRHPSYDLNVGLVVGDGGCLVVDTRASHAEARELADAVRRITPHPWVVVNTHAHFDHYFGNAVFLPAPIWGHARCAEAIVRHGEQHRRQAIAEFGPEDELSQVVLTPPDRLFATSVSLTVGGRLVVLRHLGRGHTDNDVVVSVPEAGVVFAGDLVEHGAPPAFEDAFPLDWPGTVDALLRLVTGPVVPGHGDVVDRAFVAAQCAELAAVADLARRSFAEGRPACDVIAAAAYPPEVIRRALTRAYLQLAGGAS